MSRSVVHPRYRHRRRRLTRPRLDELSRNPNERLPYWVSR